MPLGAQRKAAEPQGDLPAEVAFKLHFEAYLIAYQGEARTHVGRHSRERG